jgi:hypothetical protein
MSTPPSATVARGLTVLALGLAGYAAVVTTAFLWRSYIREAGALPLAAPDPDPTPG